MPNWCEGSLKLKGKYEDIRRFWDEGINAYSYQVADRSTGSPQILQKQDWTEIEEHEGEVIIVSDLPAYAWYYIEDTKRAFVDTSPGYYNIFRSPNDTAIAAFPFRQAWEICQSDWIELAKKYNLEIKIFAIECGVGFWCTFHVLPDGVILDNNFHQSDDYKDFVWNCPFPWMGG